MWPFGSAESYPQVCLSELSDEYDFIIVGGGTAGCVLANRLSGDPNTNVLVVERGPLADSWASRVPLFSSDFSSDGSRTFKQMSMHQEQLGRSIPLVTGKALGGSSRINQMIYSRGLPAEYDAWQDAGRRGWSWNDLKPYFLKSEHANYTCDPSVHGTTGEWHNSTEDTFFFRGFYKTIEACQDIGLPYIGDINSPDHPPFGCGRLHFTRDAKAHRNSTYHAFLPKQLAVQRKKNLHICVLTTVTQLGVETLSHGHRLARSVYLCNNLAETKIVRATREIVLCAGPFASPQILMLSGIGPSENLKEHGIKVVKDLPAVGSNLQDHFGVSVAFRVPMKDSILSLEKRIWVFFIELFRYLLFGTGMLLVPVVQLAIFTSSHFLDTTGTPSRTKLAEPKSLPDVEIMPMAYDSSDAEFDKSRGVFSFLNILLRPKSRGTVRLTSHDPLAPLHIDLAYLADPADFAPLRASLRLTARIRDGMRARGYTLDDWEGPEGEDDASLDRFIRTRNRTTYHYSSTCRMAPEDDPQGGGVVDDELFVYGVENLRVGDSSIFPWVPGTHLQALTVAVAEKCADMILKSK